MGNEEKQWYKNDGKLFLIMCDDISGTNIY